MAMSVRKRFEVFKRDDFTCRYCGKKSPEVILEVDHIVPVAEGGSDDAINLATSCWACNSGKSSVPLNQVMTGEDPHDRAIELLERDRQLREYNFVLDTILKKREADANALLDFWLEEADCDSMPRRHFAWLVSKLEFIPAATIREAMWIAIKRGATDDLRYVIAVIRNWRDEGRIQGGPDDA